jgi:hypothetical protein
MPVHEIHLSGNHIKAAYALICEMADTTGPLAESAASLVSEIAASQFDRDPATWTAPQDGQRHFRDAAGHVVPNRYVTQICEADPAMALWVEHLLMSAAEVADDQAAGFIVPDDLSELDAGDGE